MAGPPSSPSARPVRLFLLPALAGLLRRRIAAEALPVLLEPSLELPLIEGQDLPAEEEHVPPPAVVRRAVVGQDRVGGRIIGELPGRHLVARMSFVEVEAALAVLLRGLQPGFW